MANALAKLAKDLACIDDEFIFIKVQNFHRVARISVDLIESFTHVGEVVIKNKDS